MSTYSGRLAAARLFIGQWQWQRSSTKLPSCSADELFTLGTLLLSLGVLKHVLEVRYAVSVLVTSDDLGNFHGLWVCGGQIRRTDESTVWPCCPLLTFSYIRNPLPFNLLSTLQVEISTYEDKKPSDQYIYNKCFLDPLLVSQPHCHTHTSALDSTTVVQIFP